MQDDSVSRNVHVRICNFPGDRIILYFVFTEKNKTPIYCHPNTNCMNTLLRHNYAFAGEVDCLDHSFSSLDPYPFVLSLSQTTPPHTQSLIQICSGRFEPHHACSTALIQLAHLPTSPTPPVTGRRHLHNFMPAGRRLMYLGWVSSPLSHCCAVREGSHVTRVSGYRSSWKYSI